MFQLFLLIVLCNKICGENVNTTSESQEVLNLNTTRTRFGIFTDYCGPGNWANSNGDVNPGFFEDIDNCCKSHDECPEVITEISDYIKYPGLEYRTQEFSKLQCRCDSQFFRCLENLDSTTAETLILVYSAVQDSCFEWEYPIVRCKKKISGFVFGSRCIRYEVDFFKPKKWQWFDVPFSRKDVTDFPKF